MNQEKISTEPKQREISVAWGVETLNDLLANKLGDYAEDKKDNWWFGVSGTLELLLEAKRIKNPSLMQAAQELVSLIVIGPDKVKRIKTAVDEERARAIMMAIVKSLESGNSQLD